MLTYVPVEFPTSEDIFDEIPHGTQVFSTIDLCRAYHQLKVIDDNKCLVIRSRSGLYQFNVLPLGIASAVALFQNTMEELLQDELLRSGVKIYLDDILIYSKDTKTHMILFEKVLEKLHQAGLKIKREKCNFLKDQVEFLGYIINKDGISISAERIQGILEAPEPKSTTYVRGLLRGLVMLRRFEPGIAEVTLPFNRLTSQGEKFEWNQP